MAKYDINVKSTRDGSTAVVECEAPSFKDAVEKVTAGLHKHLQVVKTGQVATVKKTRKRTR